MTQYDQLIDRLIDLAIEEDIATGDVTTNSIIPAHSRCRNENESRRCNFRTGDSQTGV